MNSLSDFRAIKVELAKKVLLDCIGKHGVWADPVRYRYQCWTRDLVIAIMPALLSIGHGDVVARHLAELSRRQRRDGKIPILFVDETLPLLRDKALESLRNRKLSFVLRRWLAGEVENLTPGTHDAEIQYVIGMLDYADAVGGDSFLAKHMKQILRAMAYIEGKLVERGLILGCDWRDTMEKELSDQPLLSNNALLYHAYDLLGMERKARMLRDRIYETFFVNGHFIDRPKSHRFDPLGGALAVLHGVVRSGDYASLIESFRAVDSPHGVTIKCRHNPHRPHELQIINETDGEVVWPFVVGYTVLALKAMGDHAFAWEQYEKLRDLNGFWEWYHPRTGGGYGAERQLWSATLFLRATEAMTPDRSHMLL